MIVFFQKENSMKNIYRPLFLKIFKKYNYTWEDLDLKMYEKILKEEGIKKEKIKKEINFLKNNLDIC